MQQSGQTPSPNEQLMQFITGHWVAAAVHSVARLGIADHLHDGSKSSQEIADVVQAHAPSVYRLLR